jgi:hypothetical protein
VTNTKPLLLYDLPTVFDRLGGAWAIYNDQIPNAILIRKLAIEWAFRRVVGRHFRSIRRFEEDCANGTLPAFAFIEPVYLLGDADSGHPPEDILRSERLMGRIYAAMRRSPLWEDSVLLVLYDEHGGLFDHAEPPTGVPSPGRGEYGFDFARLGIRVPCLIVSPYAPRGASWKPKNGFLDHTSLIATLLRRRGEAPLTARDAAAADIWPAMTETSPRTDDADTYQGIQRWLDAQELVLSRGLAGPLSPETLEGQSGIDVAKAIVAAYPTTAPTRAFGADRALLARPDLTRVPIGQRDPELDEALVSLAEAVLSLPPEPEGQAPAGIAPAPTVR